VRFDAVLFDLDGTLADTAPDMARTVNLVRAKRNLAPVTVEKLRPHVSSGARGMVCTAFNITVDHRDYETLRTEFLAVYADNLAVDTVLFDGMAGLLEALDRDRMPWGVVTNKAEKFARPVMHGLGLAERCAILVGGDTCDRAKPFPDPLLHAANVLKLEPARTLYVGDDERDVMAARAAGMPVLVAGYGYLGGSDPRGWGADGIVDSPESIGAWLALAKSEGTA
jgi:N-acetyl-D-muramate 6-phosphate phosphatase